MERDSEEPLHPRLARKGLVYRLFAMYLRDHPPNKEPFSIEELARKFNVSRASMYVAVRQYRQDSLDFLRNVPVPQDLKDAENGFERMLEPLHKEGFFYIEPSKPHSSRWIEPSFYKAEYHQIYYLDMHARCMRTRMVRLIDVFKVPQLGALDLPSLQRRVEGELLMLEGEVEDRKRRIEDIERSMQEEQDEEETENKA